MLQLVATLGSVLHDNPNCNRGKEDCSSHGLQKFIVEHGKVADRRLPGTRASHGKESEAICQAWEGQESAVEDDLRNILQIIRGLRD